jgi:hypothetical protein
MDQRTPPTLQFGPLQLPKCARAANTFITNRAKRSLFEEKLTWKHGLEDSWISDFIEYGLEPFLNTHGYALGYSHSKNVSYCTAWGFAHVQAKKKDPAATVHCNQRYHRGGEAEFDWYCQTISSEEWDDLCNAWTAHSFLDTSDVGIAQRADLPFFVWNLISLGTSPAHTKFLEAMHDDSYDDDDNAYFQHVDDSGVFGGDRRTL